MARFYNDYRCKLHGNTTLLGNASDIVKFYDSGTANFYGNVIVDGTLSGITNLTTSGNASVNGDVSVEGSRLNVVFNITNQQANGFSSLYLNTPAGVGQIWSGQDGGLNVATNTAHPSKFNANKFAAGSVNSIEIQATGSRNVVINAPLLYKP